MTTAKVTVTEVPVCRRRRRKFLKSGRNNIKLTSNYNRISGNITSSCGKKYMKKVSAGSIY